MKLSVVAQHQKTMLVIERARERGGFQMGSDDFPSIHSTAKVISIFLFRGETMSTG